MALANYSQQFLGDDHGPNPWPNSLGGLGALLLSMPLRFAQQRIEPFVDSTQEDRFEWLYRPPGGLSPSLIFEALERDADLPNLELKIAEHILKNVSAEETVSINVSPASLCKPGFATRLASVVTANHCAPERIWWEVTENWPVHNMESVQNSLTIIRDTGGKIAIDDICSPQCLFDWLERYGVPDIVKVDKTVIKDKPEQLNQMVALAQNNGSSVVIEGIETVDEYAIAMATGAPFWQGHFGGEATSATRKYAAL